MSSLSFLAREYGKRTKDKNIVIYKGMKIWIGDPPEFVKWSNTRQLGGSFDGETFTALSDTKAIKRAEALEERK